MPTVFFTRIFKNKTDKTKENPVAIAAPYIPNNGISRRFRRILVKIVKARKNVFLLEILFAIKTY